MSETTTADKRLDGLTAAQLRIVTLMRDRRCIACRGGRGKASFFILDPTGLGKVDTAAPSVMDSLLSRHLVRFDNQLIRDERRGVMVYAEPGEVARLSQERRDKIEQQATEARVARDAKLSEVASAIERIATTGTREELTSALLRIASQGIDGY